MKLLSFLLIVFALLFVGVCKAGKSTSYYKNGQKSEEFNHKNGRFHGVWKRWYGNGQIYKITNYDNGWLHGLGTWWYKNGQKQREVTFKKGKMHGVETKWDPQGNIISKIKRENGVKVK